MPIGRDVIHEKRLHLLHQLVCTESIGEAILSSAGAGAEKAAGRRLPTSTGCSSARGYRPLSAVCLSSTLGPGDCE